MRLVAAMWLTCQVAAFAASPFALCHDHGVRQMGDGHECDPSHRHQHGQPASAPASHKRHHDHGEVPADTSGGASLDCRCTISDAALAALILEAGLVPPAFRLAEEEISTRVVNLDYAAPTRSHIPDTPPPRA